MGHKPSAIAEGYWPRRVDALRPYLAQIEAHILEPAGIVFNAKAAISTMRSCKRLEPQLSRVVGD